MLRVVITARMVAIALLIFGSVAVSSKAIAADDQLCDVAADSALGREDYAMAIVLHRKVLRSQPNNALAHYHLGFAYGMLGRAPEELSEYLASERLGLKSWDLFLNLGLAYLSRHQLARATEALETAVSLGPQHAEAHFNLAMVYEDENRLGEALREITTAQHLAPNDLDTANMNAVICVEMGDVARAHDIWTRMVQRAPDYAPARANLAILNRSFVLNGQFLHYAQFSTVLSNENNLGNAVGESEGNTRNE
jgi:Flp pilus assembly protein TadD